MQKGSSAEELFGSGLAAKVSGASEKIRRTVARKGGELSDTWGESHTHGAGTTVVTPVECGVKAGIHQDAETASGKERTL